MAKKPSRSKKKVRSRTGKSSPTADMQTRQTPTTDAGSPSASKPTIKQSAEPGSADGESKRPVGPKHDAPSAAPVETPPSAARPASVAATPPTEKTAPPQVEKTVESATVSTPPKPALKSPAEEAVAKPAPTSPPGAAKASKAAVSPPPVKVPVDEPQPAKPSAEPKDTRPVAKSPLVDAVTKTSPAAPTRAAETPKTTAPQKPEPEPVQEPPVAETRPATRARETDTSYPAPMPAQAESMHVVEPVPDEEPAGIPAAAHHPELFIVHISPEMAPVAKVGGLADVVFGLTGELAIRGNHVEIILPKYDNLRYDHIYEVHEVYQDLWVPWYDGSIHCTVYFGFVHGRKCFFIEPHSPDNFFNRGSVYGFPDDILRFAFFSRAAMEFLWKSGKHPDIIHCHDWQTALVPILLYEIYQQLGMTHPRACLTIHNFKHQGVTGMEILRATGLHDTARFFDYNRLRDNNNLHALNLLKGGIVYSNFITTVSPRYAMETRDQHQGFGLEPTLHTHQVKYGGVLNGIDYDVWNPEVDSHIPVRYGIDNIDAKYDNKRALRHRLMLADNDKPIVAFIGRLDPQKGLDLVRHAIFQSLERGAQFVLLGSSPDHAINADFWNLKRMLNDSPDCHLEIGYDEELSHLIYAGADMMLVPSQFEPCGLTQLISLRYGTIPVVRSVGGLADTVFDKDQSQRPLHERNGYVFEHYNNQGLESALGRAIDCYYQYPEHFRALILNAMRTDYSWNVPGQDYMNIYDFIRNK